MLAFLLDWVTAEVVGAFIGAAIVVVGGMRYDCENMDAEDYAI